jgi:hypothetical protein
VAWGVAEAARWGVKRPERVLTSHYSEQQSVELSFESPLRREPPRREKLAVACGRAAGLCPVRAVRGYCRW